MSETLRVMSFNVRFPSPDDGPNRWEARRDVLVEAVRRHAPDLIGAQEAYHEQGNYLVQCMPEYVWFGVGRTGTGRDEHMGVFYRAGRLKLKEHGNFWLSETPDLPASRSWGMDLPRMVTWGRFETGGGQCFLMLNTHLAHRPEDEAARLNGVGVIVERFRRLAQGAPVVMTGDFNDVPGGSVYQAFREAGLRDARAVAAQVVGPEGTFHGFSGMEFGPRIDWVLCGPGWSASRFETDTFQQAGRYPSDHFPIVADLACGGTLPPEPSLGAPPRRRLDPLT
jgi:endonuclease/exonuclease/phosphatase family metal-dependent hydrolase